MTPRTSICATAEQAILQSLILMQRAACSQQVESLIVHFHYHLPPSIYGTTTTPRLPACPTILLAIPSKLNPESLVSLCLIFAIS